MRFATKETSAQSNAPSEKWSKKFSFLPTLAAKTAKGQHIWVWLEWYETCTFTKDISGFEDFVTVEKRRLSSNPNEVVVIDAVYDSTMV